MKKKENDPSASRRRKDDAKLFLKSAFPSEYEAETQNSHISDYNRNLIESSLDPFVTIGPDGKITDVNTATETATGFSRTELIGSDFSLYFTEPDKAIYGYQQVFTNGSVKDYELELCHRDGHTTPVLYNASLYRDSEGNAAGVFAAARDITELKKAENLNKVAFEYTRSLIENNLDPLVTIGKEGKITDVNTATETATGFSRSDLIGSDFSDYFTEPDKARKGYLQVFSEGYVKDYELELRHRNGDTIPVLYNASVYRCSKGNVIGAFAAARDITVIKKAETQIKELNAGLESKITERTVELAAKQAELENFFNVALDLLSIIDTSGKFVRVNKAWENTLGYPVSEIENRQFLDFVHPDDIQPTIDVFASLVDQQPLDSFTNRYKTRDSSYRFIEWRSVPVGHLFYSAARDVTERIKAEEETKLQHERLRLATSAGGIGVWDYDLVNDSLLWDDQNYFLYGLTGYSEKLVYESWLMSLHPEDKVRCNEEMQLAISGVEDYNTEFRVIWADGSVHNLRGMAYVQHDKSGKPLRMIGTNWDITRQKKIENDLIQARDEAEIASRSKSEFLSRMSHELRTPLNAILGFAQLLNMGGLNPVQKKGVDRILQGGNRLLKLVNDVLDISRIDIGNLSVSIEPIKIKEVFIEMTDRITPLAHDRQVEVRVMESPLSDVCVKADRKRLNQVLNNLMDNAVKYNKPGGLVEVRTELIRKVKSPGKIKISFHDTGIGIPEKDMNKLFKPFETIVPAQPDSGGTGLGLAVVKKLMDAMNGSVGAESKQGIGSTFWIELIQDNSHSNK